MFQIIEPDIFYRAARGCLYPATCLDSLYQITGLFLMPPSVFCSPRIHYSKTFFVL